MTYTATFGKLDSATLELANKIEMLAQEVDQHLVVTKHVNAFGGYDYLPLEDIEALLHERLPALKLMLDFPCEAGHQGARIIDLETGAYKSSYAPVQPSHNPQDTGKQLTYLARYTLLMGVLGRRASKDTDANEPSKVSSKRSKAGKGSSSLEDELSKLY